MQGDDYQYLVKISENLRDQYPPEPKSIWTDSPFGWMSSLPGSKKGEAGQKLACKFLQKRGFHIGDQNHGHSCRMATRFSMLWTSGVYKFQQIGSPEYDILLCVGVSPDAVHAWVARKSEIVWSELKSTQKNENCWISFSPPDCPHSWMRPQNGDLGEMLKELEKLTGK